MQIKQLLSAAAMAGVALADFQIYYITDIYASNGIGGGSLMQQNGFSQYNGPPSCDDENRATVFASNGDVSDSRVDAYRCEGCGFDNPADFDVTELEWNTDQGHFTIYENSGYQITPADGGPLRGHCVRDSGDDLQCSFGPSDNFQGTRLFICYSDLTAVDFAN